MSTVTVLGAGNQTVSLRFDTEETTRIAQLLASTITASVQNGSMIAASDKTGGPPPVPPGKTGEFVQTKSGTVVLPNGYTALVETAANALVFGNTMSNQMILSGTTSNLTFISAGGSGTVVAGGAFNRIALAASGKGAWNVTTGDGDDIINALGSGQHTISAGGGHNAILLGTGSVQVQSSGDDTVSMGGASATIDASTGGSDLVFGGSGNLFFVGGSGGATIYGGTGSTTYYGGMHESPGHGGGHGHGHGHDDDHHHGRGHDDDDDDRRGRGRDDDDDDDRRGRGHDRDDRDDRHGCDDDDDRDHGRGAVQIVHGGKAGNNYLLAGSGAATLFGGGNNDELYAFGEVGQMLVGSSGTSTLNAAFNWGDNTIRGGTGNEEMTGGTGADQFIAGAGRDTIFATDGDRDLFTFIRGQAGGSVLVQNIYDASDVRIDLVNYSCGEEAYALSHQTKTGSSVTVNLSDGTRVTFENITGLSSKNFI